MLVTLVAILCNGQLCLEKIVTTSEQSGISMTACQVNAQIGIADWLAKGPYREWSLKGYKCVAGKYIPKVEALVTRAFVPWRSNWRCTDAFEGRSRTRRSPSYSGGPRAI